MRDPGGEVLLRGVYVMGRTKVWLTPKFIESDVWINTGGIAKAVYELFKTKCTYIEKKGKVRGRWVQTNNGELQFTYKEALTKYGISRPRFARAIDELLARGFIDIAQSGQGIYKATTLYGISERWVDYGKEGFIMVKRAKPKMSNPGFKAKLKEIQGDDNVTGSSNEVVTGEAIKNDWYIRASHNNVTGEKVTFEYKLCKGRYLERRVA